MRAPMFLASGIDGPSKSALGALLASVVLALSLPQAAQAQPSFNEVSP